MNLVIISLFILGIMSIMMPILLFKSIRARSRRMKAAIQKRILKAEHASVRYLTILELRRALEPDLEDSQHETRRMSLRSAMLALRVLGLAPATYDARNYQHTPVMTGDDVVAFPGTLTPTKKAGAEGWESMVALSDRYDTFDTLMGIGFDICGASRVAAVEPDSIFAGKFPPEWQLCWDRGVAAVCLTSNTTGEKIRV